MAQFQVTGETGGRRFDLNVLAYNESDARYAAKLVCSRGRRDVRILFAERIGQ